MSLHVNYLAQDGYYPVDLLLPWNDFISAGLVSNQDLVITAQSPPAMAVNVSGAPRGQTGGNAWLPQGYRFTNDAQASINISAADATNPRIDLIVAAVDTSQTNYTPVLTVVIGTPAASPTVPAMPSGYVGLILGQINVAASTTSIASTDITMIAPIAAFQGSAAGLSYATVTDPGVVKLGSAGGAASLDSTANVPASQLGNVPALPTDLAKTDVDNAFTVKQTFDAGLDIPSGQTGTVEGTLQSGSGGIINATEVEGSSADTNPTPNTIAKRDGNGNVVSELPVTSNYSLNLLFNPTAGFGDIGWSGLNSNGFSTEYSSDGSGPAFAWNGTTTSSSGVDQIISVNIPFPPNAAYTISGEIDTTGTTFGSGAAFQLDLQCRDTNNQFTGEIIASTNTDHGWQKFSASGTTSASTTSLVLAIRTWSNPITSGSNGIRVRNVKVEHGSVATTFSDDSSLLLQQFSSYIPFLRKDAGVGTQTVAGDVVLQGGWKVTSGAGNESSVGGQIQTYSGYGSPISGRTIFGDGSGWKWLLSKISGTTVITDLFTFHDNGDFEASGLITASSFTASSGQLGSASGTWTPANGSLNVAVGTVINIAAVPSGAKSYSAIVVAVYTGNTYSVYGSSASSGSAWIVSPNGVPSYSNGISSLTASGYLMSAVDGSYGCAGYFQINEGYLQFVVPVAGSASSDAQNTFHWAVS